MGFQDIILGCSGGYERLQNDDNDDNIGATKLERRYLPAQSSNTVVFQLISFKNSMRRQLSSIFWPVPEISPAIVFSLQWGLPVLTHTSVVCKTRVDKSLYKKAI